MFKIVFIIFFSLSYLNATNDSYNDIRKPPQKTSTKQTGSSSSLEYFKQNFITDLETFEEEIEKFPEVNPITKETATKLIGGNYLEDEDTKKTAQYMMQVSKLNDYAKETREIAEKFQDDNEGKRAGPDAKLYETVGNMLNLRANIAELEKQIQIETFRGTDKSDLEQKQDDLDEYKQKLKSLNVGNLNIDKDLAEELIGKKPNFSASLPEDLDIQGVDCCYNPKRDEKSCVDLKGKDICIQFVLNKIESLQKADITTADMRDNCSNFDSFLNTSAELTKSALEIYMPSLSLANMDSISDFIATYNLAKNCNNQTVLNTLKTHYPTLTALFEGNTTTSVYTKGSGQLTFTNPTGSTTSTDNQELASGGAGTYVNSLGTYSANLGNEYQGTTENIGGQGVANNNVALEESLNTMSGLDSYTSMYNDVNTIKSIVGGRTYGEEEEETIYSLSSKYTDLLISSFDGMTMASPYVKYGFPMSDEAVNYQELYFNSSYNFNNALNMLQIIPMVGAFSNNYTSLEYIFDMFSNKLYAQEIEGRISLQELVNPVNISKRKKWMIKLDSFLENIKSKVVEYKKKANLAKLKIRKALSTKVKYPKAPSTLKAMKDLNDMEVLRKNLNTNIYRINKAIKYHRSKKIYIPKKVYQDYESEYNVLNSSMNNTLKAVNNAMPKIKNSLPKLKEIEEERSKNLALRKIAKALVAKGL